MTASGLRTGKVAHDLFCFGDCPLRLGLELDDVRKCVVCGEDVDGCSASSGCCCSITTNAHSASVRVCSTTTHQTHSKRITQLCT